MEYIVIALVAFFVSGMTLFSGFGLGTLLLPAFALFFPVEVAVGATALVHGANSAFKASLLGKNADRDLVIKFGMPALLAAVPGAALLGLLASMEPLVTYTVGDRIAEVTPVKLTIVVLMLVFGVLELLPSSGGLSFDRSHMVWGGMLSGFFGGLSGHQGALRAAFLAKVAASAQVFVGTTAVIALLVDAMRISTYSVIAMTASNGPAMSSQDWGLLATAVAAAFGGVMTGRRYLHKVTMRGIQILTGLLLLAIAVAMGSGVL